MGLSSYVYPGALHTRFAHALGATYLMSQAIEVLQDKGVEITEEEAEAVSIAILLHDIGHGPFSHALEHTIVSGISHEEISILFFKKLNQEFDGRLTLALEIFEDTYHKHFLHQLVSSQLDMDRLDYLTRDSFFTGVSEGVVGYDRIIKMLDVKDDQLVVEEKGIYSIEKFIVSRRLMYWQVYLHKTVLSAEMTAVKIFERAQELHNKGIPVPSTPALQHFLQRSTVKSDFEKEEILEWYAQLDDNDVFASMKGWIHHSDAILSELCRRIINRDLLKIRLQSEPISPDFIAEKEQLIAKRMSLSIEDTKYLVFANTTTNSAYSMGPSRINIIFKNGEIRDIALASDQLNIQMLTEPVRKYYLCYPD